MVARPSKILPCNESVFFPHETVHDPTHCFQLFYDTKVRATTAVLATFSTAVFGFGIVGLLRPLTVYPSEMVYWLVCPIPSHIDRAELNQRFRIYLPFPFSKVYKSTH
jgi:hypothetical protein